MSCQKKKSWTDPDPRTSAFLTGFGVYEVFARTVSDEREISFELKSKLQNPNHQTNIREQQVQGDDQDILSYHEHKSLFCITQE